MALRYFPDPVSETKKCQDFLVGFQDDNIPTYLNQLREIAERSRNQLVIRLDDVYQFREDTVFVDNIVLNTIRYIHYFQNEADLIISNMHVMHDKNDIFDVLENQRKESANAAPLLPNNPIPLQQGEGNNPPPAQPPSKGIPPSISRRYETVIIPQTTNKPTSLRHIKAKDIGHLIMVKGLITRVSDVKPKITVCTYTCEFCGCELFQEIVGNSFIPLSQCSSSICQSNPSKGKITMQTRGSKFSKYQEIKIQELPDQVPVGHIPKSMVIHCSGELTRNCSPGDIVTISGIFLTVKYSGFKAIIAGLQADTFIQAMDITKEKLNFQALALQDDNELMIHQIRESNSAYELLSSAIAPEIYGHDDVKKALLLQLVGGVTKCLPDGLRIRGDINICLMGDPGVAKSQLLKFISTLSPRGVYTTGKGSSGVGLTAAVIRDNTTGDLSLEGGALVLADMGICCIDEFDKMDENDRTAIHEVMEQQTVSIAKAGITTTLNARTSVLAAANPLYGRYDLSKSISENVDLPNSLLSRFDLLFLLLDKSDLERDTALSKHVLHVHKYLNNPSKKTTNISSEILKRYIAIAKNVEPKVPPNLGTYIVEAYVNMRAADSNTFGEKSSRHRANHNKNGNQTSMTPRQLLSILRLSQSLARLRMDTKVDHQDIDEAIRLTYSSRSSLLNSDTTNDSNNNIDTMSAIYQIMIDYSQSLPMNQRQLLAYTTIEEMILRRGYRREDLTKCLQEYKMLGVLDMMDNQIYFM